MCCGGANDKSISCMVQTCTREAMGSNLDVMMNYHDWSLSWIYSVSRGEHLHSAFTKITSFCFQILTQSLAIISFTSTQPSDLIWIKIAICVHFLFLGGDSSASKVTGFDFRQRHYLFFFIKMSRRAAEPPPPPKLLPIQRSQGLYFWRQNSRSVKLSTHLYQK
jgi:hypothetical protein